MFKVNFYLKALLGFIHLFAVARITFDCVSRLASTLFGIGTADHIRVDILALSIVLTSELTELGALVHNSQGLVESGEMSVA